MIYVAELKFITAVRKKFTALYRKVACHGTNYQLYENAKINQISQFAKHNVRQQVRNGQNKRTNNR
jgi:hypothetical protein